MTHPRTTCSAVMIVKVASGDQLVAFADNIFLRVDELGKHRVGPLIEIAFKAAAFRVEAS